MASTFVQLKSGGIRGLVPPGPNADIADRVLRLACGPPQVALDQHLRTPTDLSAVTLDALDAWRAGLSLARQAMQDAAAAIAAGSGATFVQLRAGGIRGLVPAIALDADIADKILRLSCGPAQLAVDQYWGRADLVATALATLASWQAGLALAQQATLDAYNLVVSNPGVIIYPRDPLGYEHPAKTFA